MKRRLAAIALSAALSAGLSLGLPPDSSRAANDDSLGVWREFTLALMTGAPAAVPIRPYDEALREPLRGFLSLMKEKADWKEWEAAPEVHRVGAQIHYLIPLTFDGGKATYCFTFLVEGGAWFFQHLEAITLRLDNIGPLPASDFPDAPEDQKAWMREELYWSSQVNLFNFLLKEKGRDFALDFLKDGNGYFLAARAWVPFVPPARAFILYLCWEQKKLRGNKVTLETLSDSEACVLLEPIYFQLYEQSAHLKQQISLKDYRGIFEAIWRDRAARAGWDLSVAYDGACRMKFTRIP